jgi:hypothetical protein
MYDDLGQPTSIVEIPLNTYGKRLRIVYADLTFRMAPAYCLSCGKHDCFNEPEPPPSGGVYGEEDIYYYVNDGTNPMCGKTYFLMFSIISFTNI